MQSQGKATACDSPKLSFLKKFICRHAAVFAGAVGESAASGAFRQSRPPPASLSERGCGGCWQSMRAGPWGRCGPAGGPHRRVRGDRGREQNTHTCWLWVSRATKATPQKCPWNVTLNGPDRPQVQVTGSLPLTSIFALCEMGPSGTSLGASWHCHPHQRGVW